MISLSAAMWAAIAGTLTVRSLGRPALAVALYLLTFFAAPHYWWWGNDLPSLRYAFLASILLLVVVLLDASQSEDSGQKYTVVHLAAAGMVLNATFVHFGLASDAATSFNPYVELVKFTLLFVLIWAAIQNRNDFRIVLITIALGAAYIGYEIKFNERGYFNGARLEGVGAPGADASNSLACLMLTILPLIGSLWINGGRREKLIVLLSAPLVLNVILLCNSRGAFLGLIGAAICFLVIARGRTRKQAIKVTALGLLALYFLLGNPRIIERFTTTFAGSEDRDRSAASRIEFWQAGFVMLRDYPLGAGGEAFKYVHGGRYLAQVIGDPTALDRSLHNGYLAEATSWGIQGLVLKLLFIGAALLAAYRTSNRCRLEGRVLDAMVGICMMVSVLALLIHSMFGSFFSSEWGFWVVAILLRYAQLYAVPDAAARPVPSPSVLPAQSAA